MPYKQKTDPPSPSQVTTTQKPHGALAPERLLLITTLASLMVQSILVFKCRPDKKAYARRELGTLFPDSSGLTWASRFHKTETGLVKIGLRKSGKNVGKPRLDGIKMYQMVTKMNESFL